MADTKKAETKNQHYVPRFYQRFFSHDGKNIGAYSIKQRKYIPQAAIKHQSKGDYFYSANQKIEDALSALEAVASEVFNKIKEDPTVVLSSEEREVIYVFTVLQVGRTLDRAIFLDDTIDTVLKSVVKKDQEVRRNSPNAAEDELLSDEEMDRVNITLKEPGKISLGAHAQLLHICTDLKLKVLINKTKIPFITSDNPACMYSMFLERVGQPTYALGSKGLILYLPVTPHIALIYYDSMCYKVGDRNKNYVEITQEKDVENLNLLSACYANEMLYCLDGSVTPYNLNKLSNGHDEFKPNRRIELMPSIKTNRGEIIGTKINSIYCKLKLQFVKELAASKSITAKNFNPRLHRLRPIAMK